MTRFLGAALITGASSGIGAVYADRLSKRGYDLILVARNGERLKSLSTRLADETGRSVTVLPADLNNKEALAKVEAVLREVAAVLGFVPFVAHCALYLLIVTTANEMFVMRQSYPFL